MTGLIKPLLRRVLLQTARKTRPAASSIRVIRHRSEIMETALRMARNSACSPHLVSTCLDRLFALDTTTLYVHVTQPRRPFEIVLEPHDTPRVVVALRKHKLEIETEDPAPNGAYITAREYRRLGFYEVPPIERALIVVELQFRSEPTFLINYPEYVMHATIVANGRPVAGAVALAGASEQRFRVSKSR
ncbi:MAG: hypothetical protein ACRENP_09805 [Longimicrobiales bacterium]